MKDGPQHFSEVERRPLRLRHCLMREIVVSLYSSDLELFNFISYPDGAAELLCQFSAADTHVQRLVC